MRDDLLSDLTDEQRDAVTTRASPLCIIAGAGSGKTRVLTRRIAWHSEQGNIDPRRALAVTFTRKAAGELRARLRRMGQRDGVAAGTFHAIALAQLGRHWSDRRQRPRPILERRNRFLAERFPDLDGSRVTELATEIGWARARLVNPEHYATAAHEAGRRPSLGRTRVADHYAEYENAKRERRLIDFDDVLALCHEVLARDRDFAAAQRWRHQHLFVDEFQDVNPLQFALLRSWLGEGSTVTVVGDPDQAIYGWNGADPEFIGRVADHLPGCAVVHLRTNFRSSPEILAAAGQVMDRDPQPAVRPSGSPPTVAAVDGADEGAAVARAVRSRHAPGSAWRRQVVLARTNAQLSPIRSALGRHGIPVVDRDRADLLRRPEVTGLLEDWDPSSSLAQMLPDVDPDDLDLDETDRQSIDALVSQARDHLALDPEATLRSFLTAMRSGDRFATGADGVEVITFHAAKGLEWPIVHIVGLERGLVPIAHARTETALAEERRLLHVAITRAEHELHTYWCPTRRLGDDLVEREPSPWLDRLGSDPSTIDLANPRHAVEAVRDRLGPDPTEAPVSRLRSALEEWRSQVARSARIEPSAVVSDDVLDELIARRPVDLAALADVEGLPPGHARRWGPDLVTIVGDHAGV